MGPSINILVPVGETEAGVNEELLRLTAFRSGDKTQTLYQKLPSWCLMASPSLLAPQVSHSAMVVVMLGFRPTALQSRLLLGVGEETERPGILPKVTQLPLLTLSLAWV